MLVCLVTPFCIIRPVGVKSPEVTIERLREIKHWTPSKTEFMIRFVCKEYEFKKVDLLVDLAMRESSLGANKKCGDGGISCGLFQYREGTWNDFIKKYNPQYKDKGNYVDQTIMTVIALKDNQHCHWGPLREKYGCKVASR